MSSSNRDNPICFNFNSNESNKGNKKLLQRLINYRNLNIPSNLAACFLGNCKTGNGSVLNNIISDIDQSDTSIGFPSSIFESRSSSFISNDPIVIRSDFCRDRSSNDGFMISPNIVQHPSADNDLLIWRLIPSYEQDPRAFCQISVITVHNRCTTSRCVSTQVERNVVEIECNLDAVDKLESGRTTRSLIGGNIEINDVDNDWRRTTRSILRSGDRKYKNYNQLRLTFAPGNNLVTVFEYPGDDSYHYQQGINENNQYDRVNIDNQPDTQNQFQQSDGINGNDLSELSIVTVEEGFDSVSTSLLFGMIQ